MELVAGYQIVKAEEYRPGHWVCLGVRQNGEAVTWERCGLNDYFWGHYFAKEVEARADFHKRLARRIEEECA
jgi:hypothetical protein